MTTGNEGNIIPKLNELLKEDNSKVTNECFYSNQNVVENDLNIRSKFVQRKKRKKYFFKKKWCLGCENCQSWKEGELEKIYHKSLPDDLKDQKAKTQT